MKDALLVQVTTRCFEGRKVVFISSDMSSTIVIHNYPCLFSRPFLLKAGDW